MAGQLKARLQLCPDRGRCCRVWIQLTVEEEVRALAAAYKAGKTTKELAERVGIHRITNHYIEKRAHHCQPNMSKYRQVQVRLIRM